MSAIQAKFNTRLVLVSMTFVALVLFLFEHVFYIPNKNKPYAVFLAPRFYGSMNDLKSDVFNQWGGLLIVFTLGAIAIGSGIYLISKKENLHFGIFLFISAFVMTFSFQLLSPQGFGHLVEQSRSVNNGTIYSIGQLLKDPVFSSINPLEKIQYLFSEFGANDSGYTIPGTTHPPGWFLIVFSIAGIARIASFGSDLDTNLFYWGLFVTLINCVAAPLIYSISREIFGRKIGSISGLFLIMTPSALMHFCAMADSIGTIFFALAILQIIRIFNVLDSNTIEARNNNRTILGRAFLAGVSLVLAAQVAYSLIIPIFALVVTTVILVGIRHKKLPAILSGFLIPYVIYTICELLLSSGKSFWLFRAFSITRDPVFSDLKILRPFPLAQIANFEIVFVMGGFFLLPSLVLALLAILHRISILSEIVPENQISKAKFILYIWGLSTLALLVQNTARLEVERVWHWYLILGWIFAGYFILSLDIVLGSNKTTDDGGNIPNSYGLIVLIIALQFATSLILGMGIQDYY